METSETGSNKVYPQKQIQANHNSQIDTCKFSNRDQVDLQIALEENKASLNLLSIMYTALITLLIMTAESILSKRPINFIIYRGFIFPHKLVSTHLHCIPK